jgi:hypothetical protein
VESLLDELHIRREDIRVFDNTHYNTRAFVPEDGFELDDLPIVLREAVLDKMSQYGYTLGGHEPTRYELREKGLIK